MMCTVLRGFVSFSIFHLMLGLAVSHMWRVMERFNNYNSTANELFNIKTQGRIHCLILCQQNPLCKSAYFNNVTGNCKGLGIDPDHPVGTKSNDINDFFYRQVPTECLHEDYEWVPSIDFCFSFKHFTLRSKTEAEIFCEEEGAEFASLSTDEKFDFIVEYEKNIDKCSSALVMAGYLNNTDNTWYWINGAKVDMARFCLNEPSGGGSCLYMVCDDAPWCTGITNRLDDSSCGHRLQFFCERTV